MDFVHSKDRLTSPLIRKKGKLCPVSWEEAYSFIATRLKQFAKNSGGTVSQDSAQLAVPMKKTT